MRRPLIINGFMASGKSSCARALAERSGHPWVDLDTAIEQHAGKSVAELFKDGGEAHFRGIEREVLLAQLARQDAPIIAVGGGALLERAARLEAMRRGILVCLTASVETLLSRLAKDPTVRPLAAGASAAELSRLLELRAPSYAEAHETVVVDDLSPDQIAAQLEAIWQRDPLGVAAGMSSYSVEVGDGIFAARLGAEMRGATASLLITDENVDPLYGDGARQALERAGCKASTFRLVPGEEHKTPATLLALWQHALAAGVDRKSRFVGLGGGVVTDVTGFTAATWMRGVEWISAPTTLLGMVDASVGGKTAVDLPGAKNCVGAFWQPRRVLCDVAHLRSEPERGFRSALAEVVKTALLGDAELLSLLERERAAVLRKDTALLTELVRRCIAVKAAIVSQDERESGLRAALNLGHTLGHALEAYDGFGQLTHGEAVSLGLVAAAGIGEQLGLGDAALSRRTVDLLKHFGLPTELNKYPLQQAAELIAHDKKRSGATVRFVFVPEPGRVEFRALGLDQVKSLTAKLVS